MHGREDELVKRHLLAEINGDCCTDWIPSMVHLACSSHLADPACCSLCCHVSTLTLAATKPSEPGRKYRLARTSNPEYQPWPMGPTTAVAYAAVASTRRLLTSCNRGYRHRLACGQWIVNSLMHANV